jgi:hypothetical protein
METRSFDGTRGLDQLLRLNVDIHARLGQADRPFSGPALIRSFVPKFVVPQALF